MKCGLESVEKSGKIKPKKKWQPCFISLENFEFEELELLEECWEFFEYTFGPYIMLTKNN